MKNSEFERILFKDSQPINKECLQYWDTKVNLQLFQNTEFFSHIISFFLSHFELKNDWSDKALAKIYVFEYASYIDKIKEFLSNKQSKLVIIKKNKEKVFNISAYQYQVDNWSVFVYIETNTIICLNKQESEIICIGDYSSEIPIVEFIRDIVYKDQEIRGAIVLHSTAIAKDGKVIAISGNKGAGKSSLMLKCIYDLNYSLVTGDKLFMRLQNGSLIIKGWPDYPHLGMGTIRQYPQLLQLLEPEYANCSDNKFKLLFEPRTFYDEAKIDIFSGEKELDYIVSPNFTLDNSLQMGLDVNKAEFWNDNLEFKYNDASCKWHDYVDIFNNPTQRIAEYEELLNRINIIPLVGNFYENDALFRQIFDD